MGNTVNVYKNESKHSKNPKPMICSTGSLIKSEVRGNGRKATYLLNGYGNIQKVADALPFQLLVRIKICGQELLT